MGAGLIDDFIRDILSFRFCPYHFVHTIVQYHFVRYHFVLELYDVQLIRSYYMRGMMSGLGGGPQYQPSVPDTSSWDGSILCVYASDCNTSKRHRLLLRTSAYPQHGS